MILILITSKFRLTLHVRFRPIRLLYKPVPVKTNRIVLVQKAGKYDANLVFYWALSNCNVSVPDQIYFTFSHHVKPAENADTNFNQI